MRVKLNKKHRREGRESVKRRLADSASSPLRSDVTIRKGAERSTLWPDIVEGS